MSTPSMLSALCLMGIMGSPKLGTIGSPSVMTVLCLWYSRLMALDLLDCMFMALDSFEGVLMVLCPCGSMMMALCPCWSVMLVLCLMVGANKAQAS